MILSLFALYQGHKVFAGRGVTRFGDLLVNTDSYVIRQGDTDVAHGNILGTYAYFS